MNAAGYLRKKFKARDHYCRKVSYFVAHLDQCFDSGKSFDDGDIREVIEFHLGERSEDVILRQFFDCLVYECYRDSYAAVFGR